MPRFLIERNMPGAGKLTAEQLRTIAAISNSAVAGLGRPYLWETSYVAGDKIYCIHDADCSETIYRHAREGGFPADIVAEISCEIGPQTANGE